MCSRISRNNLFHWLKNGSMTEVEHRDCRGWRLFAPAQVDKIKEKLDRLTRYGLGIEGQGITIIESTADNIVLATQDYARLGKTSEILLAVMGRERLFGDAVDYCGQPVPAATEYIIDTSWV